MKQGIIKVPEVPLGTYKLQAICLSIGFSQLHKTSTLPRPELQSEFSKQLPSAWAGSSQVPAGVRLFQCFQPAACLRGRFVLEQGEVLPLHFLEQLLGEDCTEMRPDPK